MIGKRGYTSVGEEKEGLEIEVFQFLQISIANVTENSVISFLFQGVFLSRFFLVNIATKRRWKRCSVKRLFVILLRHTRSKSLKLHSIFHCSKEEIQRVGGLRGGNMRETIILLNGPLHWVEPSTALTISNLTATLQNYCFLNWRPGHIWHSRASIFIDTQQKLKVKIETSIHQMRSKMTHKNIIHTIYQILRRLHIIQTEFFVSSSILLTASHNWILYSFFKFNCCRVDGWRAKRRRDIQTEKWRRKRDGMVLMRSLELAETSWTKSNKNDIICYLTIEKSHNKKKGGW